MLNPLDLFTKTNNNAVKASPELDRHKILAELSCLPHPSAAKWCKDNLVNPAWNMGASAYNTAGNVINALAGKELLDKAVLAEITPAALGSKEYVAQNLSSGLSAAVVYGLAGKLAGGLLRAGGSALALESRLATVLGSQKAAYAYGLVTTEKTSQIIGAVAYDGLRDVHQGETRTGNMAGSLTGFLLFEHFNPYAAKMSLLPKLSTQALIGSGGAGMQQVVSQVVSGRPINADELLHTMTTGAFMNTALPAVQHGLSLAIGQTNIALGRGNPLERQLKLNNLQGQSPLLDSLARENPSIRVQPGSHNQIEYRKQKVTVSDSQDPSLLGHELAHNQWQKNNQAQFKQAADLLKQGHNRQSWQVYRQARLDSELHARLSEQQIADQSGQNKAVQIDPVKIARSQTPEGISYEELWRKDFQKFRASGGKAVAARDFNNLDLGYFHKLSGLKATFEKILHNKPLAKHDQELLAAFKIQDTSKINHSNLELINSKQRELVGQKLEWGLKQLGSAGSKSTHSEIREVIQYISGEVHSHNVAGSTPAKFVCKLIEDNPALLHQQLSCRTLSAMLRLSDDPSALHEVAKSLNRLSLNGHTDNANRQAALDTLHTALEQFAANPQQVGRLFLANALLESANQQQRFNALWNFKEFSDQHLHIPVGLRQIAAADCRLPAMDNYLNLLQQHSQNIDMPSWRTKDGSLRPEVYPDGDYREAVAAEATLKAVSNMTEILPDWVFIPSGKLAAADKMKIDGVFINLSDGRLKPVDFTMKKKDVIWSLELSDLPALERFKNDPAGYINNFLQDGLHFTPEELTQAGITHLPSFTDFSGASAKGLQELQLLAENARQKSSSTRAYQQGRYQWSEPRDKWSYLSEYAYQALGKNPQPPNLHSQDPVLSLQYETMAKRRLMLEGLSERNCADFKSLTNDMVDFLAVADCTENEALLAARRASGFRASNLKNHQDMLAASRLMTISPVNESQAIEAQLYRKNSLEPDMPLSNLAELLQTRRTINNEYQLDLSLAEIHELSNMLKQTPGLQTSVAVAMQLLALNHRRQLQTELAALSRQKDPVTYALDNATRSNNNLSDAWESLFAVLENLQPAGK